MNRWLDTADYYVELLGLSLMGPAQLDEEHDPIVALRLRHGRTAHRWQSRRSPSQHRPARKA